MEFNFYPNINRILFEILQEIFIQINNITNLLISDILRDSICQYDMLLASWPGGGGGKSSLKKEPILLINLNMYK